MVARCAFPSQNGYDSAIASSTEHRSSIVRFSITNQLSEIGRVADWVEEFCREHGIAQRESNTINVALDEILSNVIHHGYADSGVHDIAVTLTSAAGEITVEIEDDGTPFDPTTVPAPTLTGSLVERDLGGLGLVFVRALVDQIDYQRVAGRNHLKLRWRIPAGAVPGQVTASLRISAATHGAGSVLTLEGRMDSAAARTFRDRLLAIIRSGPARIAVNMEGVSSIASAGIWVLLAGEYLAAACGGSLAVYGFNKDIRKLFHRTGVAGTLRLCETASDALATLE